MRGQRFKSRQTRKMCYEKAFVIVVERSQYGNAGMAGMTGKTGMAGKASMAGKTGNDWRD